MSKPLENAPIFAGLKHSSSPLTCRLLCHSRPDTFPRASPPQPPAVLAGGQPPEVEAAIGLGGRRAEGAAEAEASDARRAAAAASDAHRVTLAPGGQWPLPVA